MTFKGYFKNNLCIEECPIKKNPKIILRLMNYGLTILVIKDSLWMENPPGQL